jgi:crossover junction endodeoxyribonuclease RuvC
VTRPGALAARILGLDPGSRHTGYGFIEKAGSRLTYLESGILSPPRQADLPERLLVLYERAGELLARLTPDMVAVEDIFHAANTRSVLKLAHARGVLILAAVQAGVRVSAYPPATVKKTVVGAGAADKARVAWMVARLLPGSPAGIGHDASDALAVALCHAAHLRRNQIVEAAGVSRGGAAQWPAKREPS